MNNKYCNFSKNTVCSILRCYALFYMRGFGRLWARPFVFVFFSPNYQYYMSREIIQEQNHNSTIKQDISTLHNREAMQVGRNRRTKIGGDDR